MRLIIDNIDGTLYLYRESEEHFKLVEPGRARERTKIKKKFIDNECNLSSMPNNSYAVFKVKK